jgi:hypothetical protein
MRRHLPTFNVGVSERAARPTRPSRGAQIERAAARHGRVGSRGRRHKKTTSVPLVKTRTRLVIPEGFVAEAEGRAARRRAAPSTPGSKAPSSESESAPHECEAFPTADPRGICRRGRRPSRAQARSAEHTGFKAPSSESENAPHECEAFPTALVIPEGFVAEAEGRAARRRSAEHTGFKAPSSESENAPHECEAFPTALVIPEGFEPSLPA